jgi:ligand-binding sensor domain-containing protein
MRINYLRLLLCVLQVFFYSARVQSDESLLFQQISTHDGLSQNTVRSLLVDSKGFIWAGTLDGLNRYDGSRFVTYKPAFGKNPSLNDHRIRSIYEDKTGFLWVRKYDNTASCYNPFTESFINIYKEKSLISLDYTGLMEASDSSMWLWDSRNGCIQLQHRNGEIRVLYQSSASSVVKMVFEDSQKNIWIGLAQGLILIDKSKKFHLFFNKDNSHNFRRITESDGVIYFLTEQSIILRYDLRKKTFMQAIAAPENCTAQEFVFLNKKEVLLVTRNQGVLVLNLVTNTFNLHPFPESKKLNNSTQLITDSKGGLWLFDHTGILRHYNPKTGKLKELNLLPSNIIEVIDNERYNILIDSQDNYWITTYGNGLFKYDPFSGKLENYRFDDRVNSPASNYLLSIAEDFSGNIWLGSEYSGIIKVVKQKYKIEYIRPEIEKSPGSSNNVKVVFEDSNGNVWVGTKNGSIYLYDKSLKNSRCIQRNLNPYTIMEDHKKRIWIGTKGNGVYVYDILGKKEIFHFQNDGNIPGSLHNNSIFNILQDRHNRIWVATFGGGLDLLIDVDKDQNFRHFFDADGNLSFIRYLYEDKIGNIWAGSYGGLIRFYPQEFIANPQRYRVYNYNSDQPEGLNCNDIKTIFEDSKNRLWVGTAGGGLNLLVNNNARNKGHFVKYTKEQGLPSDIVTDILESRDNSIWIGTESGIARFNESQKTFTWQLLFGKCRNIESQWRHALGYIRRLYCL